MLVQQAGLVVHFWLLIIEEVSHVLEYNRTHIVIAFVIVWCYSETERWFNCIVGLPSAIRLTNFFMSVTVNIKFTRNAHNTQLHFVIG